MKYIDADRLREELQKPKTELKVGNYYLDNSEQAVGYENALIDFELLLDSLQQEQWDMGEVSDGYHTFNELYYYRMLYNAAFFNLLPKWMAHKSKRHHDGEECFGGGWFIVMANLPTGQISNHYELKDWDLFRISEKEIADEWDGHTPQEAAERLRKYLQQEQPEVGLDFQVFSNEMNAVFNLPKEITENTEENPLNWEYAIARHFFDLGRLNARKEE